MQVEFFTNDDKTDYFDNERNRKLNEKIKQKISDVFSFEHKNKIYKLRYVKDGKYYMRCSGRVCRVSLVKNGDEICVSGTHSSKCVHAGDKKSREILSEIIELKSIDGEKQLHMKHKRIISEMFMTKFFDDKHYPAPIRNSHLKFVLNDVYKDENYRILLQNINDIPNSVAIFQENECYYYLYLLCSHGNNGGVKLLMEIKNLSNKSKKDLYLESISVQLNNYYEKNCFKKADIDDEKSFKKFKKREAYTTLMIFKYNN